MLHKSKVVSKKFTKYVFALMIILSPQFLNTLITFFFSLLVFGPDSTWFKLKPRLSRKNYPQKPSLIRVKLISDFLDFRHLFIKLGGFHKHVFSNGRIKTFNIKTMKDNCFWFLLKHSLVSFNWFTFICMCISKSKIAKISKNIFDKISHKIKLQTKVKQQKDKNSHM